MSGKQESWMRGAWVCVCVFIRETTVRRSLRRIYKRIKNTVTILGSTFIDSIYIKWWNCCWLCVQPLYSGIWIFQRTTSIWLFLICFCFGFLVPARTILTIVIIQLEKNIAQIFTTGMAKMAERQTIAPSQVEQLLYSHSQQLQMGFHSAAIAAAFNRNKFHFQLRYYEYIYSDEHYLNTCARSS